MYTLTLHKVLLLSLFAYSLCLAHIKSSMPVFVFTRGVTDRIHNHLSVCFHCVGFWCSTVLYIIYTYISEGRIELSVRYALTVLLMALASAGLCYVYGKVVAILVAVIKYFSAADTQY